MEANTYNGPTMIEAGTLTLSASGSVADSDEIVIAGGAVFNVTALSLPFSLSPGQIFSNSTSTARITGNFNTGSGTLSFTYTAGIPSFTISSGTLTLSAGTGLTINNTGTPLGVGTYAIIAAGGGTVDGSLPASYAVTGAGIAAGTTTSLAISGGALTLTVSVATPPKITGISVNGPTLMISAMNGKPDGPFVLLGSTNLTLPLNQWTPILTNEFDGNGGLRLMTNVIDPNNPLEFYILSQ
jgi:hypothetical protein